MAGVRQAYLELTGLSSAVAASRPTGEPSGTKRRAEDALDIDRETLGSLPDEPLDDLEDSGAPAPGPVTPDEVPPAPTEEEEPQEPEEKARRRRREEDTEVETTTCHDIGRPPRNCLVLQCLRVWGVCARYAPRDCLQTAQVCAGCAPRDRRIKTIKGMRWVCAMSKPKHPKQRKLHLFMNSIPRFWRTPTY